MSSRCPELCWELNYDVRMPIHEFDFSKSLLVSYSWAASGTLHKSVYHQSAHKSEIKGKTKDTMLGLCRWGCSCSCWSHQCSVDRVSGEIDWNLKTVRLIISWFCGLSCVVNIPIPPFGAPVKFRGLGGSFFVIKEHFCGNLTKLERSALFQRAWAWRLN